MSYTELESGYQGLRESNRPAQFFVGEDGNFVSIDNSKVNLYR